jgi:hypothetical protein
MDTGDLFSDAIHCSDYTASAVDKQNIAMEHWELYTDSGKPKFWGKNTAPVPFCPLKILHGKTWYGTHVSAMTGLRATAQKTQRGTAYFTLKLTKRFKYFHET